jgi:hypothetical protein
MLLHCPEEAFSEVGDIKEEDKARNSSKVILHSSRIHRRALLAGGASVDA